MIEDNIYWVTGWSKIEYLHDLWLKSGARFEK